MFLESPLAFLISISVISHHANIRLVPRSSINTLLELKLRLHLELASQCHHAAMYPQGSTALVEAHRLKVQIIQVIPWISQPRPQKDNTQEKEE
jgi:hypothetical protein